MYVNDVISWFTLKNMINVELSLQMKMQCFVTSVSVPRFTIICKHWGSLSYRNFMCWRLRSLGLTKVKSMTYISWVTECIP